PLDRGAHRPAQACAPGRYHLLGGYPALRPRSCCGPTVARRTLPGPGARVWRGATAGAAVADDWRGSLVRPQGVPAPRRGSVVDHAPNRYHPLCQDTAYGTRSVQHGGSPADVAPDPAGRPRLRGARTLRAGWPLRPRYRDAGPGGYAAARPGAPGRRNAAGDYGSWVDARPPETGPWRDGKAFRDVDPASGYLAFLAYIHGRTGGQQPRLWASGAPHDVRHPGRGCPGLDPRRILSSAQRRDGRRPA